MATVVLEADAQGAFDLDKIKAPPPPLSSKQRRAAAPQRAAREPPSVSAAASAGCGGGAGRDEDDEWVKVSRWDAGEATAASLKEQGNEAFRTGDFDGAIAKYTEALDQAGDDAPSAKAAIFANRAAAHAKNGNAVSVVSDCGACLALESTYVKALVRRAVSEAGVSEAKKKTRAIPRSPPRRPPSSSSATASTPSWTSRPPSPSSRP